MLWFYEYELENSYTQKVNRSDHFYTHTAEQSHDTGPRVYLTTNNCV